MFTVEDINEIRQEYMKYTSYNIPEIQDVIYEDTHDYFGKVLKEEVSSDKYIIHLSNDLNDCSEEFQKAVVFHELTHIYDYLCNTELSNIDLNGIMHTFSEAHAESIKLRYLLKINTKQKINSGIRYLESSTGKTDIGTVASTYLNQSLTSYYNFQKDKLPKQFMSFLDAYCHYCGYLSIRIPRDANVLLNGVLSKFPIKYRSDLKTLYYAIIKKDFGTCYEIYSKIILDALETTMN